MQKQPVKTRPETYGSNKHRNTNQQTTEQQRGPPRRNKEESKQPLLHLILKKEMMLLARISIFLFQGHNQNDWREERLPPKPEKQ